MPVSHLRVAHRYIAASGVAIGETVEHSNYRIHRFRDSFRITELTNAGKRGKRVDEFWVSYWTGGGDTVQNRVEDWMEFAARAANFKLLVAAIETGISLLAEEGHRIESGWSTARGVDVAPAGFKALKIHGQHVHIESGNDSFVVKDLDDRYNEPTCIARGKQSVKQVYRWVTENMSRIPKMTFSEVLKALDGEGIDYHYYCAMD